MLFLPQYRRKVRQGLIKIKGGKYRAPIDSESPRALTDLNEHWVTVRCDPTWDIEQVLVFKDDEFVCVAEPVEESSMLDAGLTSRKIREKRRLKADYMEDYKRMTACVPDGRTYSSVPVMEKAAAISGRHRRKRIEENQELYRERSPEELSAAVAELEALEARPVKKIKDLPDRPRFFLAPSDRYSWCPKI